MRLAAIDKDATDEVRNLAYSAGLCHNLGLMALAHMEPARTNAALDANRGKPDPGSLSDSLIEEFDSDHKIVTLELARRWTLPQPMTAAYYFRAYPESVRDNRLALVVAAGATVVGKTAFTLHTA